MDNLWLLTEERPKPSVVKQIIELYCRDFGDSITKEEKIKIKPIFINGIFKYEYVVEGLTVKKIKDVIIKIVSGNSSFLDFLLFKQQQEPNENNIGSDNLLMGIEETKTSDDESRNTGVYQRGSKFVFIEQYYKNVKLYMLYNEELEERDKKPSDTSIFGTNILLTLGVTIIGKTNLNWFKKFNNLDELVDFKQKMRKPPKGNVPIEIIKNSNKIIVMSGRLSKPADAGNIAHDPNIGALSMIAKCIRKLGWDKDVVIVKHGVSQQYINRTRGNNKFLYICKILNLNLDGIKMPDVSILPVQYWHYEYSSEKISSILLHMVCMYYGMECIYENHAGCERGYFKDPNGKFITLPKKDTKGENLFLPDVVLYNRKFNLIYNVEGKKFSTLEQGLEDIQNYDSIEKEYISKYYKNAKIYRCLSIYGGDEKNYLHKDVLFYMNKKGEVYINTNSPEWFKEMFRCFGIKI